MATPENTFIASVHRHLPAELYRMKNHNQFNGGIADVWYSGSKADLWVEYKFVSTPKRAETVIDIAGGKDPALSHLQQHWLTARHEEGRNVGVLIGSKTGGVWFPGVTWGKPLSAGQFIERLQTRVELASLIRGLTSM